MNADAVIVGGGIVGAACAYYLAQEGISVIVVEPGPLGGGATAACMGHLVVMDDSEAQFALTRYSLELWSELDPPTEAEVRTCGTIWVASDAEEMAHVETKLRFYTARGVVAERLDEKELRALEPTLSPGLAGGLLVPHDKVVYPMSVVPFLIERAGAKVVRRRAVKIAPGAVTLETGDVLDAGVTVNAAGVRAQELTPGLPIQPRKGHLVITDRYPSMVRHQLVELGYLKSAHGAESESVAFNVQPRGTGQLLIGSSRQFVGWESSIDRQITARMLQRATKYLPEIGRVSALRTWIGFRAATPDNLPLIGPFHDNLYVAAGHEGLGITTSLATGKLIADAVAGRAPAISSESFLPGRFARA